MDGSKTPFLTTSNDIGSGKNGNSTPDVLKSLCYDAFALTDQTEVSSARHSGLPAAASAITIKEDSHYGFDQTHHTFSGCRGSGNGGHAKRICSAATQSGNRKFYEKDPVRIYCEEEAGSGFPLLLLPGGGLNATIAFFAGNSPFNAIEEFKGQYRCITADLRNAPSGQSTGPVEVDGRGIPYADDRLGLMDHLQASTSSR